MAAVQKNNFSDLLKKAQKILKEQDIKTIKELAKVMDINRTTLMPGLERNFNIKSIDEIRNAKITEDGRNLIGTESSSDLDVEMDGNFGVIRSVIVEGQIKTVDELLKLAGIDRKIYEVTNPRVKKWDVALKLKTDKDHEIVKVVPSIYIEVPLRTRYPTAFEPVIQPIHIDLPKLPKIKQQNKAIKRALIINDPQIGFRRTLHTTELVPFHDRRVLDLALQIAQNEQIDHISFGGDCLDLSEWSSKFLPEPEFFWTTQPALLEWSWWLTQFRLAQPSAEMKILEGNHDLRMPNLITQNLRQAYKLRSVDELNLPPALSVPRLLALHTLNAEYVANYPDNGYWLNDNVFITHGDLVRSGPGDTAKAIVNKQAFTTIFGHIHRRELVSRRLKTHSGDLIYSAFCPGCACRIDGAVPGSKSGDQWQNGIALIEYTNDSENIVPIAISDGSMIYNGSKWSSRDREKEIGSFLTKSLMETHGK